jgi:hypothetical protein
MSQLERIHASDKLFYDLRSCSHEEFQFAATHNHSLGIYYAFGALWLRVCQSKYPDFLEQYKYIYRVTPDFSKIAVIDREDSLSRFNHEFSVNGIMNWGEVAKSYAGMEVDLPFSRFNTIASHSFSERGVVSERFDWLVALEVPGGCIWSPDGIAKWELIQQTPDAPQGVISKR